MLPLIPAELLTKTNGVVRWGDCSLLSMWKKHSLRKGDCWQEKNRPSLGTSTAYIAPSNSVRWLPWKCTIAVWYRLKIEKRSKYSAPPRNAELLRNFYFLRNLHAGDTTAWWLDHTPQHHTHTWSAHCALSPNNKLGKTAPVQHLISDCGFHLLDVGHYPSTSWSWTESLHICRLLHHLWLDHAAAKYIVNSVSWRTHLAVHIIFCFYIKCWYHKNWLFNSLTTVGYLLEVFIRLWILPWSVLSLPAWS